MKKILLTLALAFCCAAGQGQTTAKPADVNIQELNTKWAKFTQYAEQKQINKAVGRRGNTDKYALYSKQAI